MLLYSEEDVRAHPPEPPPLQPLQVSLLGSNGASKNPANNFGGIMPELDMTTSYLKVPTCSYIFSEI